MHPQVNHQKQMDIGPFWMDVDLVTRSNYSRYLNESSYKPQDPHSFLRGWTVSADGEYTYPNGTDDVPVTSITVQEA